MFFMESSIPETSAMTDSFFNELMISLMLEKHTTQYTNKKD